MTKYHSIGWAAIVAAIWMAAASGTEITGLPVQGRAQWPLILLELGSEPPSVAAKDATTEVYTGEMTAHEGDESVRTDRDEVVQVHKGFGRWSAVFRFDLRGLGRARCDPARATCHVPVEACGLAVCVGRGGSSAEAQTR